MPKTKKKDGVEQIVAKAFAHPLRVQILIILNERVASPNLLAQELDQSLNLVAYHVRVLEKYDCIELVDTKQRRGATEHFYRATRRQFLSDSEWARMPQSLRPGLSGAMLKSMFDDIEEAVEKRHPRRERGPPPEPHPDGRRQTGLGRRLEPAQRDPRQGLRDPGRSLGAARRRARSPASSPRSTCSTSSRPTRTRRAIRRIQRRSRPSSQARSAAEARGAAQGLSGAAASGVATTKEKLSSR